MRCYGDENIINKTFQVGTRAAYLWPVPGSLLKLGVLGDFSLCRRTHSNNAYNSLHDDIDYFDFLELTLAFTGMIHGIYFGVGGTVSFLARYMELPSYMNWFEPYFTIIFGYTHEFGKIIKVFAGVDVRVALFTESMSSAREWPTFGYTVKASSPVGFNFVLGVVFQR